MNSVATTIEKYRKVRKECSIVVRLEKEIKQRLDKFCEANDITSSEFVRIAILEFLENK